MDVAVTCERLVFFDRALGFRRDRGQLSLRRLDLVAQRMIVEIRLGEFCRRRQLQPEIMHCAQLRW